MRTLNKDEIECRLQSVNNDTAYFLLYKTPRTDVKVLTEAYGDKWKNEFHCIDGKLYCTISVWNEQIQAWVSRSNVGTESNIEQEKGQASDAIKRAGFMWEIGSELYTAPQIKVDLTPADLYNGKCNLKLTIKEINISPEHKIKRLVLVDKFGNERFKWSLSDCSSESTSQNLQVDTDIQTSSLNGNNPDAIIQYLKGVVNDKPLQEGVSQKEWKRFIEYYIRKVEKDGWDGEFCFEALFSRWISRMKSK